MSEFSHVRYDTLDSWLDACERLDLKVTEFGSTSFIAQKRDPWLTMAGTWCNSVGYIKEDAEPIWDTYK